MTDALPLDGEPSVTDLCRHKLREMFAPYLAPGRRVDRGAVLWTLLTERERAFLCKAAKVDSAVVTAHWSELPDSVQADLLTAWQRFADWVRRVELHLDVAGRR